MKEKTSILSAVSIYHGLNDGAVTVIPILFPIFKDIFDLSYTQIGLITGVGLLVSIIAQLIIGRVSDGKNIRTLLTLGVLFVSLSMFILTKSQGFLTLFLFMTFLRLASSFYHPIGTGWISRIFKKDRLDWAMGIQSGFADFGAFIAISTTLYLSDLKNWEFPLYLWAIAGAIVVLIGLFLTRNIKEEAMIVKKVHKKQNLKEAINESMVILKRIKLLIPAFMISGGSWGVVVTFLPLLLVEKTSLSLTQIGIVVAIWIGIGCIVSFYYGKIKSVFGRKNAVIFSYITIAAMSFLLSFVTNVMIILPILVLLGVAVFITYPALAAFVSEETHETMEGGTFAIIFTLQLGGGTLLLFIGGYLSDLFGIGTPFALLGSLSLILTALLLVYRKTPFILPN